MSVKQWRDTAAEAAELLGPSWHLVGRGRRTVLMRENIGWWVQYIEYETTTLGELNAVGGFLGRPLSGSQQGDRGANTRTFLYRGETNIRRYLARFSHDEVAVFASAVSETVFDPVLDLGHELQGAERRFGQWVKRGEMESIYRGPTRSLLVGLRVVCASRPREQLAEDVRWVLDDPLCDYFSLETRRGKAGSRRAFFGQMLPMIESGDRAGVEELIRASRLEMLRLLDVSDDLIEPLVFPEPLEAV